MRLLSLLLTGSSATMRQRLRLEVLALSKTFSSMQQLQRPMQATRRLRMLELLGQLSLLHQRLKMEMQPLLT
jgi:hypothetical protein